MFCFVASTQPATHSTRQTSQKKHVCLCSPPVLPDGLIRFVPSFLVLQDSKQCILAGEAVHPGGIRLVPTASGWSRRHPAGPGGILVGEGLLVVARASLLARRTCASPSVTMGVPRMKVGRFWDKLTIQCWPAVASVWAGNHRSSALRAHTTHHTKPIDYGKCLGRLTATGLDRCPSRRQR